MKKTGEREISDEMIKDAIICKNCDICKYRGEEYGTPCIRSLARALQAERAKPKVWDGAPVDATNAEVWFGDKHTMGLGTVNYTRELPKTRAREIAEELSTELIGAMSTKDLTQRIESAILKREAELNEAGK